MVLKSEFGKNLLPIIVTYISRKENDSIIKNFTVIKDLTGRYYINTALKINNDSVTCFAGDIECYGSYQTIDSVKVVVSDDLYSPWLKVDSTKGLIQLTLQTDIDLDTYIPLYLRLKKEKTKLKFIRD